MWSWQVAIKICSILVKVWKMVLLCHFSAKLWLESFDVEVCTGLIKECIVFDRFPLH